MKRPLTALWVLLFGPLACLAAAWADTLTVTVSRANVRQGPGLSHAVMATLPRGATFPVLSTQNGWHRIQLDDGRQAWIAVSIVRLEASAPSERALERLPEPVPQRRTALVIGNAAYAGAPLRNSVNDAVDMAAALRRLGFEVQLVRDARRRQMHDAVRAFGRQLQQGGVGLFYFAGHGLQVAGENYLVPIGADIEEEYEVEDEAVSAGRILGAMEAAGNGLNLVILDACRNNPYSRRFRGGSALGLAAPVQAARGSLIAYATSPNAVAEDGAGRNGLYTKHLLRFMQEPGLRVEQMFKQVRIAVERESGGRQTPWELSSLTGDFSFTLASTVGAGASDADAQRRRKGAAAQAERRRREMEPGRRFRDCPDCPEMVVVPSGSFMMGSPAGEAGRDEDEGPQHRVTIDEPFAVGVFEVTFRDWKACLNGGGCNGYRPDDEGWGRGDRPVINVSWDDAQAYVRWLSGRTGQRYRLLSESEWEYVARGGTRAARYWGASASGQCRHANGNDASGEYGGGVSCNDGHAQTSPVGTHTENGFGVHDVLGNVWEWVQDCWHENYRGAPADGRAWERVGCSRRVLRGGSWFDAQRSLRSASRDWITTGTRNDFRGFRIARTLTP